MEAFDLDDWNSIDLIEVKIRKRLNEEAKLQRAANMPKAAEHVKSAIAKYPAQYAQFYEKWSTPNKELMKFKARLKYAASKDPLYFNDFLDRLSLDETFMLNWRSLSARKSAERQKLYRRMQYYQDMPEDKRAICETKFTNPQVYQQHRIEKYGEAHCRKLDMAKLRRDAKKHPEAEWLLAWKDVDQLIAAMCISPVVTPPVPAANEPPTECLAN